MRIYIFLLTIFLPGFFAAAEQKLPIPTYTTFTFRHAHHDRVVYEDYNGDNLKDIITASGRTLKFYPQRPRNHYADLPAQTLFIAEPYSHYTFAQIHKGRGKALALLSSTGIDLMPLNGDTYSSPPVTFLCKKLTFYPRPFIIIRTDFFLEIDGDGIDDVILPEGGSLCIYLADNFTTPALTAPMDITRRFLYLVGNDYPFICAANPFRQYIFRTRDSKSIISVRANAWLGETMRGGYLTDPGVPGKTRLTLAGRTYILKRDKTFEMEKLPTLAEPEDNEDRYEIEDDGMVIRRRELDFNGDGLPDRAVYKTTQSTFAPKTVVKIFLAHPDGSFAKKPDSVVRAGAISPYGYAQSFKDVDGDGHPDLILLDLDLQGASLESNLRAFFRLGIPGSLDFYLWTEGEGFPRRPSFSFPITISQQIFDYRFTFRDYFVVGKDFTGGKRPDLLIKTGQRIFSLHRFTNRKSGFARKPDAVFELPATPEQIRALDLNGDKRNDLIFSRCDSKSPKISLDVLFLSATKK